MTTPATARAIALELANELTGVDHYADRLRLITTALDAAVRAERERNETLTAALESLASEAQRYTDPQDRHLKRLADEAQAALDQARGGGA